MKRSVLRNFAVLTVKKGLNVQPGQEVWITCQIDQPEFVNMVVEECYRAGARKVVVDFHYEGVDNTQYRKQHTMELAKFDSYEEEKLRYQEKVIPCRLFIESEDPDGMAGLNQKKLAKVKRIRYKTIHKYRDNWENKDQWCIVAVPGAKWAKKVFPELPAKKAIDKLWEAIIYTSRVTDDPIGEWEKHNADIHDRCIYLNSLDICELHYTSSNGTDLRVGLMDKSRFCGASETSLQGITFNPNIPSEECFTSPMKGKAEGIVYATLPLSYQGQLIEDFWIEFKNGKAVNWGAKKNKDLLTKMLKMDEGASYLGECALVPWESPINRTGILFYNTLFDENARCHLALGAGYADTIKGYENYTLDECRKMGLNDSMIHVDFMIGAKDLSIVGKARSGRNIQIFENGTWAF